MDIIEEKIISLIATSQGKDPSNLSKSTRFVDDLGMDSLDLIEVMLDFEDEYNIELTDKNSEKIICIGDLIKEVKELIA